MKKSKNLTLHKTAALVGTVIMAIGSFMACLSTNVVATHVGNVLLVASILVMFYGYSAWQP